MDVWVRWGVFLHACVCVIACMRAFMCMHALVYICGGVVRARGALRGHAHKLYLNTTDINETYIKAFPSNN